MTDNDALGVVPLRIPLHLTAGAEFVCAIESEDGTNWSPSLVVTIEVGAQVWTATVSGTDLLFNEDQPAVTAAISANVQTYKMFAADPDRICWMEGPVKIHA